MRIVYDTNIYISLLLFPNDLTNELNKITQQNILVCPDNIIEEVLDTLLKKISKFSHGSKFYSPLLEDFWNVLIELNGSVFLHQPIFNNIPVKIRDKKDTRILQTIIASNCDVFVTGDKDFKVLGDTKFKILTISEFVNTYKQNY